MNLKRIQRLFQISMNQMKSNDFLVFAGYSKLNSNVVKDQLINLFQFQCSCFEFLERVHLNWQEDEPISEDGGEDFSELPQGHLVWMTCGHLGIPNRQQEKRVSRLLRKSGFIPMLQQA
jgi:hypothetical protein